MVNNDTAALDAMLFQVGKFDYLGNDGADTFTGGNRSDEIEGRGGIDTLNGREGNDIIVGGLGNDKLDGGTGDEATGSDGQLRHLAFNYTGDTVDFFHLGSNFPAAQI